MVTPPWATGLPPLFSSCTVTAGVIDCPAAAFVGCRTNATWVAEAEEMKTHAAPALLLSTGPPTMAVLPSAERDTDTPWLAVPTALEPTSLVPHWVQAPALLVQTHAAPAPLLSPPPPTMAALPSKERDTELPCRAFPTAPEPTSLVCWVQALPLLVQTHAAPTAPLSPDPPTMAVLPSAERDTESP